MRSNLHVVLFLGLTAVAMSAACSSSKSGNPAGDTADYPPGINDTGKGAGSGTDTGLPCNVQAVLENRCIGCHREGSPTPLLTYDDLMKPAPSDSSKKMAEKAVERMKSADKPMPPPPAQRAVFDEISAISGWVAAGMPKGTSCTPPGGGVSSGGNYNTPTTCSSNKTWSSGDTKSPQMRPGNACITCHSARGGPAFTIAGTIYPTAHEPNECYGKDGTENGGALTVTLVDVNGGVISLKVNSAGNFYSEEELFPPLTVSVSDGTNYRSMGAPLTAGDCNACHTEKGVNGAPGRIMAP
jgi:mono/diheme cytochrome c family protein